MKTRRPGSRMMTALVIALVFALMTFAITAFAEGESADAAAGPSTYATIFSLLPPVFAQLPKAAEAPVLNTSWK